ncbi:MAG: V-type ATP synthase subunit D [Candidatus Marinimicrobia bacterium]|nr:V-type ATP synthase subunit D [Candidatus Neomarinimicrobiota bacterium]
MSKIKLTKNELKKQKESLKRFTRYLPTLELKKQQLLIEVRNIQRKVRKIENEIKKLESDVDKWVDVFGEDVGIQDLFEVKGIDTATDNVAGIDVPIFNDIKIDIEEYDLMKYPLWVDFGLEAIKKIIKLKTEIEILHEQQDILEKELRITIQRINLFDKIKIPESRENIRRIRIFLGDQQTAAVVRGKISKSKLEKKRIAEANNVG